MNRAISLVLGRDADMESLVSKEMITLAMEQGDRDGTGKKINHKMVIGKLRQLLWETFETSNVAAAKVLYLNLTTLSLLAISCFCIHGLATVTFEPLQLLRLSRSQSCTVLE